MLIEPKDDSTKDAGYIWQLFYGNITLTDSPTVNKMFTIFATKRWMYYTKMTEILSIYLRI